MEFKIVSHEELNKAIASVRRKATVIIGGFVIAVASCMPISAHAQQIKDLVVDNPIATYVGNVPVSDLSIQIGDDFITRKAQLEFSIGKHGGEKMNSEATSLWQKILSQSADIPFSEVFVQYDDYGESFYMAYKFKNDRRVEATMYVDDEDPNVYFSVYSGNERFYQSYLPQSEFFTKSVELWTSVNGERG